VVLHVTNRLSILETKINYTFSNQQHLTLALSHRSSGSINNERLEFLGDSILGFVIANELYQNFPKISEGELSRLRARIVKGTTLTEVALELGLGEYVLLGPGEKKSGGHNRDSILADTVEAIIGAIYLDAGIDAASSAILRLFSTKLKELTLEDAKKDPKTQLQELLQGRKLEVPEYHILETLGAAHNQTFKVRCDVVLKDDSLLETQAVASSRRKSEQQSAQQMLEKLLERGIK